MDPLQAVLQPIIESFAMDIWRMVEAAGIDEYTAAYGDAPTLNPQVGIDFDLLQRKASRFAEEYRTPFLRDLQKADRSKLFKKLKDSLDKGETFDKFYKRLDASGMFSDARARKIFRTEVNRFNNEGALQRYKDEGVPFKMLLVHQPCEKCAKVLSEGKIVASDQPFSNGYMAPPFHPHCMCTIAPVYELPAGYKVPIFKKHIVCEPIEMSLSKFWLAESNCVPQDMYTDDEIDKQAKRFGSYDEQTKRFNQEIDEYYKDESKYDENKWAAEELRQKIGTDEYNEMMFKVENTTLHHRTNDRKLKKILKSGKLKSSKLMGEKVDDFEILDEGDTFRETNTYVFFHESRGSPYYGDHELVFKKKVINERYLMEWTRDDSIMFVDFDEMKDHILTTAEYNKYSSLLRLKKGGVFAEPWGCIGEARVLNFVDVNEETLDRLNIEAHYSFIKGNGDLTKKGIAEYERETKALLKEYPWLEGKIYIIWSPDEGKTQREMKL